MAKLVGVCEYGSVNPKMVQLVKYDKDTGQVIVHMKHGLWFWLTPKRGGTLDGLYHDTCQRINGDVGMSFIEAVKLARQGKKVYRQSTSEFALKFFNEVDDCFSLHTSQEDMEATDWVCED